MKSLYLLLVLLMPCIGHSSLLGTEQSWKFMQSVGGIDLGKPESKGGAWKLPLICDISGAKTVTVKPILQNSGMVWADNVVKVIDGNIFLTVETGIAQISGKSGICGPADLGHIKSGKYSVMYRDPDGTKHSLGQVDIGF